MARCKDLVGCSCGGSTRLLPCELSHPISPSVFLFLSFSPAPIFFVPSLALSRSPGLNIPYPLCVPGCP
uniref:Uncharacterized protein n=1 Tax=Anguilla anguilla TaxID=7936 RepID=A0A0E9WKV3_ANGAN